MVAGLAMLVSTWFHAQQYLWPLVLAYGADTSAPMLVRVASTPSLDEAPVPFGLVAPLWALVPTVLLGALCLVATDRLALRAGADRAPAGERGAAQAPADPEVTDRG